MIGVNFQSFTGFLLSGQTRVIELNAVLQTSPVALVVLDDDDFIRQANEKAVAMGLSAGTTLTSYIANLKEKFVDHVRHQPESQLYRLEFQHGEKEMSCEFLKKTMATSMSGWWMFRNN